MRNYKYFDGYLDKLNFDLYPQPPDRGHTDYASEAINWAYNSIDFSNVLDVGCGQGFCCPLFEEKGIKWTGVTLGKDFKVCEKRELNVYEYDMTFLEFEKDSFDVIFARHILEHSPFPIITLMEWRRIAKNHLVLILPAPDYWGIGGRNHYSVLEKDKWWYALTRAGWGPIHQHEISTEDGLFMRNYRPEVQKEEERRKLKYPGHPKVVEYWYICEKIEQRIN